MTTPHVEASRWEGADMEEWKVVLEVGKAASLLTCKTI